MLELYKNIRELRIRKELSQSELARLTGYTDRSSIAKIEKGEVDLTQSKIALFAKALDVTPGDLMGWAEYQKNDLKPLEKSEAEDIELLQAYHSASEDIKSCIRRILGMKEGD